MRILVVEDEKKIATFVQRGLKEFGFVADVVHRGDEALSVCLASVGHSGTMTTPLGERPVPPVDRNAPFTRKVSSLLAVRSFTWLIQKLEYSWLWL
jgi:hypothetical protein